MTRGVLGLAALLAGLPALAWSGETKPPAPSAVQDVVFLGDARPVLLRLHIQVEGRPFRAPWQAYLDNLFADLDRDGDGVLSPAEAARVPSSAFLQALLQGELYADPATAVVPFRTLDANGDGRVTRRELADYYRRSGLDALVLQVVPRRAESDAVTDALFKLLDRNGDGKLSRQELENAATVLQKVDLDEDELITPEELVPRGAARAAARHGPRMSAATPEGLGFLLVPTGEPAASVGRAILQRYDRNRDGRLSRAEIALDPAVFDALDTNRNGTLEVDELARLVTLPPDLELQLRVGAPLQAEVFNPTRRAMPLAERVRRTTEDMLAVSLGDVVMELHGSPAAGGSFQGVRQFYLQQFQAADDERKGFLVRKQVEESPYLNSIFVLADRDGDGKLTSRELTAFLELHAQGAGGFTTLSLLDQSLALFELLDANRDGRLSLRELHGAWSRLQGYDRNGDGCVSRDELPRQYQLWFSKGWARLGSLSARPPAAPKGPQARGPLWFRMMDVNGDGDVSRREFLGSDEAFRQLDTDGDGLISVEEAERYEALQKDKKNQRSGPDRR
jgi:Ca2+-binding EF-hand superfamily protein